MRYCSWNLGFVVTCLYFSLPCIGMTATFTFTCDGTPYPTVQWFRGPNEITEDDNHTISYNKDTKEHSFTIHSATPEEAGKYEVVLTNTVGVTKQPVSLMVQAAPEEEVKFKTKLR